MFTAIVIKHFLQQVENHSEGMQEAFSEPQVVPPVGSSVQSTQSDPVKEVVPSVGEEDNHNDIPPSVTVSQDKDQTDDKEYLLVSEEFDHSPQSSDHDSPKSKTKVTRPRRRLHDPIFNRLTRNQRGSDSESTG